MSSHWEWSQKQMEEHDRQKPFAPENGSPLKFKAGDRVIFTNEYGVRFQLTVTGYYSRPEEPCALYARGCRYFLDWACHWFPVEESSLELDEGCSAVNAETFTEAVSYA